MIEHWRLMLNALIAGISYATYTTLKNITIAQVQLIIRSIPSLQGSVMLNCKSD